jgi:hypothetical protein
MKNWEDTPERISSESIFLAGINTEKENRNYLAIGDKLGRVDVACLWAPLHLFYPGPPAFSLPTERP